ncbi:hypothetical protein Tco_0977565 [Tanacetum coccineum]|uniref:Reverse transcriptase Ty1/copia-type domain-containing protein n=1 Tax=Tanacetum coccineum TaxID=301880 RepID=A0ABQ5EKF8_9ASTR
MGRGSRYRHGKTPYELLHDRKPDLSYLHVFCALCYPNNDSENLGKLQAKADIVFDEFFSPLDSVVSPVLEVVAPALIESTGLTSSTSVDQDAPYPSTSQTTQQSQSIEIPLFVKEESHDLEVAHMSNDLYFDILIPKTGSEESSTSDVIPTIVHLDAPISEHLRKWTKDHPLQNIIGELSRHISIRLQLHEQALLCYYDAFLYLVEPKTYKDALTKSCWIEVMQEELNEFERLKVWELVSRLDKVMKRSQRYTPDADHAGCQDTRRSKSEVCNCWETDLLAGHQKGRKVLQYLVRKLNTSPYLAVVPNTIALCCNNVQHSRSKYIDIRYHFIKEQVENGVVELYFVRTDYQLADIFTKALCQERIEFLIDKLGMRNFSPETLNELADESEE